MQWEPEPARAGFTTGDPWLAPVDAAERSVAGAGEVPGDGQEGQIVARLDPTSKATQGQETELWLDSTKIKLFDPSDGRSLTATGDADGQPAATEGQSPAGRDPASEPEEQERSE